MPYINWSTLEGSPSHKATPPPYQKNGSRSIFFGKTYPPQHIFKRPLFSSVWVAQKELLDHGGTDVAGGGSINADTVPGGPIRC